MTKGTIILDGYESMEKLVTILAENDYTVQVRQTEASDVFYRQFEVKYKREDEYDEP